VLGLLVDSRAGAVGRAEIPTNALWRIPPVSTTYLRLRFGYSGSSDRGNQRLFAHAYIFLLLTASSDCGAAVRGRLRGASRTCSSEVPKFNARLELGVMEAIRQSEASVVEAHWGLGSLGFTVDKRPRFPPPREKKRDVTTWPFLPHWRSV